MAKFKTPTIKALRAQGGTFYTMSSTTEDIGLNINERNNKVAVSHYALLNLPKVSEWNTDSSSDMPNVMIKDELQNYLLNLETAVRNQSGYDYSANLTVSERAFWKWLQHEGIIEFEEDKKVNGIQYYKDSKDIVQCFGKVAASNYRTDSNTIYNEIYVQVPSSFGKAKSYFKEVIDDNYKVGTYGADTGITGYYDENSEYNVQELDTLSMEFNISNLRSIYNDTENKISLDDLAIDPYKYGNVENCEEFDFNTVILYYSIYDSTNESVLATNLFGILFLDGTNDEGKISPLHKKKSSTTSGVTAFGNGYSFRINLKTNEIADDTEAIIEDYGAPYGVEMISDFTAVAANLAKSVEILNNNIRYNKILADKYDELNNKINTVLNSYNSSESASYAPLMHATENDTYGLGSMMTYGHVKVSDTYKNLLNVDGTALSQRGAADLYAELNGKIGGKIIKEFDVQKYLDQPDPSTSINVSNSNYYIYKNIQQPGGGSVPSLTFNFNLPNVEYQGQIEMDAGLTTRIVFNYNTSTSSVPVTWLNLDEDSLLSTSTFTGGTYRFSIINGAGLI